MTLDTDHSPLYVQLSDLFRQRIQKGFWKNGECLPSLETLAEEFSVARVTVRQAVERLSRDGLLKAQRGRGTFVTGRPKANHWLHVETTLESLSEVYRDTQPTILNTDESNRQPILHPEEGVAAKKYVYMRRVHARDGKPYCVIDIYLDASIFVLQPEKFRTQTVIPLLLEMPSVKIVTAKQVLTISSADLEIAKHLLINVNSPVADVRRVFTGPKRKIIYLAEVTYPGDFIRMDIDLKPTHKKLKEAL